ncbi:MAG: hypothetical protein ACAH17_03780 [Candidatus Paceibacterota bacterium]
MKKALFVLVTHGILAVIWMMFPEARIWISHGLSLWWILVLVTWGYLLFYNDKAYKPRPFGTRLQRREFGSVLCFGFFMLLFLVPPRRQSIDPTTPAKLT